MRRGDTVENNGSGENGVSVSVPVGVIAAGVLLGLAAAVAYVLSNNGSLEVADRAPEPKVKSAKGPLRKFGIMTLVRLIENDATRKLVIAALKAMARRS